MMMVEADEVTDDGSGGAPKTLCNRVLKLNLQEYSAVVKNTNSVRTMNEPECSVDTREAKFSGNVEEAKMSVDKKWTNMTENADMALKAESSNMAEKAENADMAFNAESSNMAEKAENADMTVKAEGTDIESRKEVAQLTEETSDSLLSVSCCLVHSQKTRCLAQNLVNQLRSGHVIPVTYINKIAGLICTCRRLHFHQTIDDMLTYSVEDHLEYLLQSLNIEDHSQLKTTLLRLITTCNGVQCSAQGTRCVSEGVDKGSEQAMCRDHAQLRVGCDRLIILLKQVIKSDHSLLVYSRKPRALDDRPESEVKYPFEGVLELSGVSYYLGHVFGHHGKHIKEFQKRYDCEIRVMQPDIGWMCHDATGRKFHVRTVSADHWEIIKRELRLVVDKVLKKREKQDKISERFQQIWSRRNAARLRARKNRHAAIGFSGNTAPYVAAITVKDEAKDNYSTKYQHMLKERGHRKLDKENPMPSLLEESESRCVNCLMPYSSDIDNSNGACKYHSGYIQTRKSYLKDGPSQKFEWTCCGIAITAKSAVCQKNSHKNEGCESGRHIWKPHRRAPVSKKHDQSSGTKQTWTKLKHYAENHRAGKLPRAWMDQ